MNLLCNNEQGQNQGYTEQDMGDIGDEVEEEQISEEDRPFLILNKDTGKYYDMRDGKVIENLTKRTTRINSTGGDAKKGGAWQDWWKDKRNNNHQYLLAAENGDLSTIKKLLNKSAMAD